MYIGDSLGSAIEEVEVSELESDPLTQLSYELVAALDVLGVGAWVMEGQ